MAKYKNKYRINSNRHRYWNYSRPGGYFITICTPDRVCFLGNIFDGVMHLSEFGQVVRDEILRIPDYHPQVRLGGSVVMPDHVHLIVDILRVADTNNVTGTTDTNHSTGNNHPMGMGIDKIHEFYLSPSPSTSPSLPPFPSPSSSTIPWWYDPKYPSTPNDLKQFRNYRRRMIIPKIMGKFKMLSSREINVIRKSPKQKNWQDDYYDHIVRTKASYRRIQKYITNNPVNWKENKLRNDAIIHRNEKSIPAS